MKTLLISSCILLLVVGQPAFAQEPFNVNGAWRLVTLNDSSLEEEERVLIFSDTYFMFGQYKTEGDFVKAAGGTYTIEEDAYQQTYDFHTEDSMQVQKTENYTISLEDGQLLMEGDNTLLWERIDEEVRPLNGAWRFSARVDENDQPEERRIPGPRKTMKILSGSRF